MTLGDIFLAELERIAPDLAPAHHSLIVVGNELAKKYNANLETLGAIASDYVKTHRELEVMKGH